MKFSQKFFTIICFLICFSIAAYAFPHADGKISGRIIDKKTGEELLGVIVMIEGTSFGAATDYEGKFVTGNLRPGTYNLIVSYVSYNKKVLKGIEVKPNEVTSLTISMEESTRELGELVILAEANRESTTSLFIQQKNAATISDGISAEIIKRTPDRTTSDVLKRVSGASIQDNRFAIIRGLNERYTAAYINGAPLPSSESDKKAFSFDIFPSNLLDNLVIIKTATPDLPAEFGGGVIQINTKSIPDKDFHSFSINGGYNAITTGKNQITYKGGKTDWLGIDDGTRALPSGIPDDKNYPVLLKDQANMGKLMKNDWGLIHKNFSPNLGMQYSMGKTWDIKKSKLGVIFALTYSKTNSRNTTTRNQYDSHYDVNVPVQMTENYVDDNYVTQTLAGALLNLSYKIHPNHQIGFKNIYSINSDDRVIIRNGTSSPLDNNPILVYSNAIWFTSNRIYTGQINGIHYFNSINTKVNWVGSYGNVDRDIPNLRRNSYVRNKLVEDNSSDTLYIANVAQANVGPDYAGNRFYGSTKEKIYSFNANASQSFNIKSIKLKNEIKYGGLFQYRERNYVSRQLGLIKYAPSGSLVFPDSVMYLPQDLIFDPRFMGSSSSGYGGFALSNKYKPTDSYKANSSLVAVFLMFDHRYKERLRLIWGVRMESYQQELITTLDNLVPYDNKTTKMDILPSANLIYSLTENQNIRLCYSQTVNRPEFRELAPFAFYDYSTRLVVSGNRELQRALIHNYDIRYEWYAGRGQLVSTSGFYKKFINPIEQIARQDVTGEISFANIPTGKNYGLEFEYRVILGVILNRPKSNFLNNLTLYTNLALIKSKIDLQHSTDSLEQVRSLQGQSPYIVNAGLQYYDPKTSFSFSATYNRVGPRIAIVGNNNEIHIWESGRDVIDLQVAKSFLNNKMEVRLNLKDLLAQKQYFFQDRNHDHKLQEKTDLLVWATNYGSTYSLSISYRF